MDERALTADELTKENAALRCRILELEQMEEALRETENRYRNLVESSPDFIYYLDNQGRLVSINQSGMLGFTPEDEDAALGMPFANYIYPDDRDLVINSFFESIARKRQITKGLTFRVMKKNGDVIWVELHSRMRFDKNGNYFEEVGILRDVTDRKQMEDRLFSLNRELEETNRDLKAAYQWARDGRDILKKRHYEEGIGFLVDRDGLVEWISETALVFTGRSRQALIGSNFLELLHEEGRMEFLNAMKQAWVGSIYPLSVPCISADGLRCTMEVNMIRVSTMAVRRMWVMMQYPAERQGRAKSVSGKHEII